MSKKLLPFSVCMLVISIFSCTKEVQQPAPLSSSQNEDVAAAVLEDTILYKNNFTKNAQEWLILGDAQGSSSEPTYLGSGGKPGGYISATDDVTGGVWYFSAPQKFLNNMEGQYGKTLKFYLKQSSTSSQFDSKDLIIEGNGLLLYFNTDYNPEVTWTKYRVPLRAGRWLKEDGTAPTGNEMRGVLNNLTRLWIRGEYRTGDDIGGLDNVAITETLEE